MTSLQLSRQAHTLFLAPSQRSAVEERSILGFCRTRFAPGPWQDKFGTADGHPNHEGHTARAQRSCLPRYPVALTTASVFALEAELEGTCPFSLDRLKRRQALSPACKYWAQTVQKEDGVGLIWL